MDVPEAELTLALLKPDAVQSGHVEAIMHTAEKHGFVFVTSSLIQLTRMRAEEFYEHLEGSDCFEKLTRFMSSGVLYALVLGKKKAVQEWASLVGPFDPDIARKESPSSLRARYGTNSIRNAVHGSSSPQEAIREIRFFFPTVVRDPLPDEASSKEYFDKHLRGTLLKGLTALAKAKPHSDPLHVIKWCHQPFTCKHQQRSYQECEEGCLRRKMEQLEHEGHHQMQ
ncbi:hypothetical protein GOP47_0007267 [Adiantum capillus-veneris]|uniref:Nucleoside diphosphate kinase-like domain-containing protein n=1 Tax=Adiantum capillus-veneris TaxID=13818 RepID=A0A9D4V0K2_ADICA|nr:hypothetical protein GOP47_0007267 [Adiantum capillus-veneris]